MKELKTEFRKYVAIKLLSWSLSIMPSCKFKAALSAVIVTDLMNGM